MGKASKFQSVLIYLFILSLAKKIFWSAILVTNTCEKLRFNTSAHRNIFWMQFLFLQLHLYEAESTAFAARTVIVSLNKQNSFSDRFIACLPQKYFLQWASQKTARNQNIKGVFNCRIWDCTAGMVFDKTMFSAHTVTTKKDHLDERDKMVGFTRNIGFYLFSVNIFVWLKQSLNLPDIIISVNLRICTEQNTSPRLSCQWYCFKSLWKQELNCKFDDAVGYRSIALKNIPKTFFQNGRIREKGHIFDIIYIQVAQITYGKSSHEIYTHNDPWLQDVFCWKCKTSSSEEKAWDEKCWLLHMAAFQPANYPNIKS